MALHGQELIDRALALSRRAAEQIAALPGVRLLGPELDGRPGVSSRDGKMVLVDVTGLWISGYTAGRLAVRAPARGRRAPRPAPSHVVVTVADVDGSVDRLVAPCTTSSKPPPGMRGSGELPSLPPVSQLVGDYVMPP